MAQDTTLADIERDTRRGQPDEEGARVTTLEEARAALSDTIARAGLEHQGGGAGEADDLQKVGAGGLSFELRLNGVTIALDGKDVNQLAPDEFKPFLEAQRLNVAAGALDSAIERALAAEGPGKAVARVRALQHR